MDGRLSHPQCRCPSGTLGAGTGGRRARGVPWRDGRDRRPRQGTQRNDVCCRSDGDRRDVPPVPPSLTARAERDWPNPPRIRGTWWPKALARPACGAAPCPVDTSRITRVLLHGRALPDLSPMQQNTCYRTRAACQEPYRRYAGDRRASGGTPHQRRNVATVAAGPPHHSTPTTAASQRNAPASTLERWGGCAANPVILSVIARLRTQTRLAPYRR